MNARARKKIVQALISVFVLVLLTFLQQQGILKTATSEVTQTATEHTPGTYEVARFDDGDTIVVNMEGKEEKVRFIGVDTPETQDPRKPVQCFGKAASQFTKDLIGSSRVRLEADPANTNRDRYQRLLRYIYLPDGTLVNKKIIEDGYGFALTGFPFTKMEEFRAAQKSARENNRGLWNTCQLETTANGITHTKPE